MNRTVRSIFLGLGILAGTFSFQAFAESKTFQLKGVHCESCTAAVEKDVCKVQAFKVCKAEVTDQAKELGKLHLETKSGTIETAKIKKILDASNYTLGAEI